ncbi:3'-5' exonuclease [Paenibacillus protaetiae]|uniref:3'-5' exonuclease n=1 Tax=Paenibacillus protaetiae TaxID=2509456 RepID=UPI0031344327
MVDAVNNVFRPIMRESVAEMDYDSRAELVSGAYYPEPEQRGAFQVELAVISKSGGAAVPEEDDDAEEEGSGAAVDRESGAAAPTPEELQTVQLEARWMAMRLKQMMDERFPVYDGKRGVTRPMMWRDAVILLRATQQWAPVIIEELQANGIPAYAELSTGYFDATEVETMLSLLQIIDNPYQDIPLAGVLRSPLVGLSAEELALIRIHAKRSGYYDAVLHAAGSLLLPDELRSKLSRFLNQLDHWREEARQGALSELLWHIYRETGYYEFVGGLAGGVQRQANLRALHDRARSYEATSFRGLFRFLRFIERMRDSGGDLGTARAAGEQQDVVRIMSIHKSKGLEFPVVFIAGLGKSFNQQDTRSAFLKHKQLGFGPRYVDPERRISYPTLPFLAIRRRMKMEMLAEEMRILYVALTRPKEKMILVGTVSDADKKLQRWKAAAAAGQLPDYQIASATSFFDWIGPLAASAFDIADTEAEPESAAAENSRPASVRPETLEMKAGIVAASLFGSEAAASAEAPGEMQI